MEYGKKKAVKKQHWKNRKRRKVPWNPIIVYI